MSRAQELINYLNSVRGQKFRPGKHDCALFVAGWVKIATGDDHARGWRGYRSLKAGQKKLAEGGHEDHIALAASILHEVAPAMAANGDLAVVNGNALGIINAERVFVLHPDGLAHVSRMKAERAFKV